LNRRHFLGSSVAALAAGAALGAAAEEAAPPAQAQTVAPPESVDPRSGMPYGMIGKVKVSRLMLGGNLVSGFMHNRDLKYVPQLFRAYCTEEKILETFKLCEENGINTVFESGGALVQRYNRERGGHMQIIPHFAVELDQDLGKLKDQIKEIVDTGVPAIYLWGVTSDKLVQAGQIKTLAKGVELAKTFGLPVGVGGHSLRVPMECEKARVPCDFYVKTLHQDNYPTAVPKEFREEFMWFGENKHYYDNMWCINPEETVAFMSTVRKPWVAFKVLAAGAILPRDGFSYAFRSGADFIAVGMFDFQIKEDSKLAMRILKHGNGRQRPWCA
jgi:hypothetical protein